MRTFELLLTHMIYLMSVEFDQVSKLLATHPAREVRRLDFLKIIIAVLLDIGRD